MWVVLGEQEGRCDPEEGAQGDVRGQVGQGHGAGRYSWWNISAEWAAPLMPPLAVGDRYECRTRARTVTVTRLWVDEYGADAVAFEWRGGMSGAAHSAEMFHQLYRPAP